MFDSEDVQKIEKLVGCKIPDDVLQEASNEESVLWREIDGEQFGFVSAEDHAGVQRFANDEKRSPLAKIPELKIFWMDGESNFIGIFVSGPMVGRLALIGHDTNVDCAPLYRNLNSFVASMAAGPEAPESEWHYQVDYINTGDEMRVGASNAEIEDDIECIEQIKRLLDSTDEPIRKRFLNSCVISLTPKENAAELLPLTESPDHHVCGRACAMLGYYQFDEASRKLAEIAVDAKNPARFMAIDGLGLMKTEIAKFCLIEMVRSGKPLSGNVTSALSKHGFEPYATKSRSDTGQLIINWQVQLSVEKGPELINMDWAPRPGCWWIHMTW